MRTRTALLATAALMAAAALAAPASALTITTYGTNSPLPAGQTMIMDFDTAAPGDFTSTNIVNGSFTFTGGYVRAVGAGLDSGVSAPPPGDATLNYETVLGGQTATLTSTKGFSSFSFYLGSPDSYNTVVFKSGGVTIATLNGADILNGPSGIADGNQGTGRRISYDFGSQKIDTVQFSSGGNSFEFDDLAATVSGAVPEPASWALMLVGFGAMGVAMRRRRPATHAFG